MEAYDRVQNLLRGNEEIVFESMAEVTRDRPNPFVPPADPGEFDQKHAEIRSLLGYRRVLRGLDTAVSLMEEVGRRVQATGGLVGLTTDEVLDAIFLQPSDSNVSVRLNQDLRWAARWAVSSPIQGDDEKTSVFLEIHSSDWGEVVPTYVTEYINIAIYAYEQRVYGPAIALLSIAIEATLRDVLETRGYTYGPGAPSVDIYSCADAEVSVEANSYTVTFRQPMPRAPARFLQSTGGDPTVEIRVRRVINRRRGRVDLSVIVPHCLVNHWSSDNVEQPAQRRVNGLGEALDIARNQEQLLTPNDLPTDLDEVIKLVRNNLIHLSGQTLNTPLYALDPAGDFSLGDFLDDPEMVHDLIANVPRFINRQYVELRRAGHLAP